MPITLEGLVAKLAKRPLPAMAVTIQRVKLLRKDPNTSNHDLQKVIGLDPGFTMDIYRSFGTSLAHRRGPASDIAHAISLLGPMPVKIAANNLPILNKTLPDAAKIGIYQCYSRAVHASIYAKSIGELRGDKNPDEMGHAALLHNCGEMALWAYAGKSMQEIYKLVRNGADYGSASHSVLGFTLKQLNSELANKWHLSPLISETTDHTWFEKSRSMAVQIACSIARESAMGWNSSELEDLIELLSDYKQHNKERAAAFIHSLAAQADRQLFGMPLPASTFNMLRQPPVTIITVPEVKEEKPQEPFPEKLTKENIRKEIKQSPVVPKKQSRKPSLTEILETMPKEPRKEAKKIPITKPIDRPEIKTKPKHDNKFTAPKSTTSSPKIKTPTRPIVVEKTRAPIEWQAHLSKYMRTMRNDLGLQNIMFAMIGPNKKFAKVSELKGVTEDSDLNNFVVNIEQENLFRILLSKQQGFWLRSKNREKFLPMIPDDVLHSIDQNGFFCMSIFIRNKPVGFIYADGKYVLNDDSYADFKQLCAELSLALGQKVSESD